MGARAATMAPADGSGAAKWRTRIVIADALR
jgi:hypothetical protein